MLVLFVRIGCLLRDFRGSKKGKQNFYFPYFSICEGANSPATLGRAFDIRSRGTNNPFLA